MKQFIDRYFVLLAVAAVILIFLLSGLRLCSVESGSMEPTIPTGSLCFVTTRVDYEDIALGDVVVYIRQSDGKRIIHRVIAIAPEGMITKGDANSIDDGVSVSREKNNLYARSLFHIPYLGRVSMAARTPAGICVIALLAAALLFLELRSEKKQPAPETAGEQQAQTEPAEQTGTAEKKE